MIKSICQFARIPITIKTFTRNAPFFAGQSINSRLVYCFSQKQDGSNVEAQSSHQLDGDNRASSFYRNSIRRININEKGRGKFTEHHLLRLIKLTEKVDQEPLLFEAYYNYLGHFTIISSTTVDKMLLKALSFQGCSLSKIIQVFECHNHLGYFPHYNVTTAVIQLARSDQKSYHKLLDIFIKSPLIKFNAEITNFLLAQLNDANTSNTTVSFIIKLLAQREHFKLLEGIITRRDLLKKFVQAIEGRLDSKTFKTFRRSASLKQWCGQVLSSEQLDDQLHFELAVVGVTGKQEAIFGDNLILIKDNEKLLRCLLYLEECPTSFIQAAVKYLNSLQISQDLKVRLQEFKPSSTDPSSVQTE